MTTQIKRRRGTTTEHSSFIGAEGELTVDTTKDTVVVHDGSTAGGHPLAKESGGTFTTVDINSGNIDNTIIGATTQAAISGTTGQFNTSLNVDGTVTADGLIMGDAEKIQLGASTDFEIWHDNTNSINVIEGNFHPIHFLHGAEKLMVLDDDADVQLYYNNGLKLATTNTGVDVTGTVTADGLTVAGTTSQQGTLTVGVDDTGYDVKFFGATAGKYMLWDESADSLIVEGNLLMGTTALMQDFGADKTTLALKGKNATDYAVIQMGNGGTSGNNQLHGQIAFYDVHSSADLRVSAISSYREVSTNSSYLSFATSPGSAGLTEAMRIDRAGAVKIFGDLNHVDNGGTSRILYDKSANLLGNTGTNVTCATLSKASGSFKIDHPLESKTDTHHLIHSFVESPTADNIYRGKIALVLGSATVNIDTAAGMTDGTFAALNREVQCFTSNESGWTAVKGSVSGNTLTITAQEDTCTDTVSWLVVGERKDPHMYATDWTDENGKVIVEPLKPVIEETEEETP